MTPRDKPDFLKLLTELAEVFGRDLKPGAVELYWDALKDLALSTVQTIAKSHAKRGKYFPKPAELRPAEAQQVVRQDERSFKEGEQRATLNLDELRREKGDAIWRPEVRFRHANRVLAVADPGSHEYADAQRVWAALVVQCRGY